MSNYHTVIVVSCKNIMKGMNVVANVASFFVGTLTCRLLEILNLHLRKKVYLTLVCKKPKKIFVNSFISKSKSLSCLAISNHHYRFMYNNIHKRVDETRCKHLTKEFTNEETKLLIPCISRKGVIIPFPNVHTQRN